MTGSTTAPDAPDAVDRFLSCAAARPGHPAVSSRGQALSYAGLEERVRRFAAAFAGVPGPRVLIALPQGADAYAAMLAAGLAGGYYAPVNTQAPLDKLHRIVGELQPDIVVGAPALGARLAEAAPAATVLDPAVLPGLPLFEGGGSRHELAYVIFTSGSTGMPKGVMISRQALAHYVAWLGASDTIRPDDRVSQHPNIAFDLSVMDIYGALCQGASLHPLAGAGERAMPARILEREAITVWVSVPSVISLMMRAGEVTPAMMRSVRLFSFCGEPLLREQLQAIFAARPDVVVQNTYGPTEATCSMTGVRLTAADYAAACGASVALGEAIPGMGLHLVGGAHADEGELVISGPQLAAGYWNDPERTAGMFRPLEIDGVARRAYFTGDWAERRNGHVFFKERIDFQVKVRGYRIELDEVAAALRACGWPVVCVFKLGDGLAAVVERRADLALDEAALRAAMAGHIEQHAVPATIREIDHMPRNENDKIDRRMVLRWLEAVLATEAAAPLPAV
jgi:D-alanine--poly(phosphoribitol) ligase subunit 1